MKEKKLTDEEIVKAYEYCIVNSSSCVDCPYDDWGCAVQTNDILELVNRQKAEIERLTEELKYYRGEKPMDIIGKKFNRLTDLEFVGTDKYGNTKFLCECECGKRKVLLGSTVYSNERIMFEPVIVKVITTHQSMNLPVSYTVFATAKDGYGIYLSSENFNKDWFLTREEAEKRLKELQNGQENM